MAQPAEDASEAPAPVVVDEVELSRSVMPEAAPAGGRTKWVALIAVLLAVGAWVGYNTFERLQSGAHDGAEAAAAPSPSPDVVDRAAPPRLEAEPIDLPPLGETDAVVRMLVGRLSSHPSVAAWLATDGLIENFTVVALNIAEGKAPAAQLRPLLPQGPFRVKTTAGRFVIDPASYARYDTHAAAVGALDATGTARLYLTLKPRIVQAYRELGQPDGQFDPVLERALGVLLTVPDVDASANVREKIVTYEYVDPRLEGLTPAARQFLRMGPGNVRIVQSKLREIASLLGLTPRAPART